MVFRPHAIKGMPEQGMRPERVVPSSFSKSKQTGDLKASGVSNSSKKSSPSATSPGENATQQPIERLTKVLSYISTQALRSAVTDMASVMWPDWEPRPFPVRDYESDMRSHFTAIPRNDNLERTAKPKSPRVEHSLSEEIEEINGWNLETSVEKIDDKDVNPGMISAAPLNDQQGTFVKLSYKTRDHGSVLKNRFSFTQMLLIPTSYPRYSPIVLDWFLLDEMAGKEDLFVKVKSRFCKSVSSLSQTISLKKMVKTWHDSVCTEVWGHLKQGRG